MVKTFFVAATALFVFSGCWGDKGPETWTSYIYPDKTNNKRSMENGIFPTVEECKSASLAKLKILKLEERGDYQCGLNCGYHEGMKTEICEKMTK